MAQINLTQLLGTDNIALSRPTINQNFTTVQNAINTLELYLNTTPAGAALAVGNVQINVGANSVNDPLFVNQASGIFQGNLTVNQALNVIGASTFTASSVFENGLALTGTGPNAILDIGQFANPVDIFHRGGMFVDEQYVSEPATPVDTPDSPPDIHDLDITDKRVVYLDYLNYDALLPANAANKISLIGAPVNGQRLFIRIANTPLVGGPTYQFDILTNNFGPEYSSNDIEFNGTADELKRQWVELLYKPSGWVVLNSHPDVNGI
jgi:hypothetical protein